MFKYLKKEIEYIAFARIKIDNADYVSFQIIIYIKFLSY